MMAIMKKQRKSNEKRREHRDQRQRDPKNKESSSAHTSGRLSAALLYAKR
jgi:hypothetical protein